MANLGIRHVLALKPYPHAGIEKGDVVEASCWKNLDAYIDCAEVTRDGQTIGLGRITHEGWRYATKDDAMHWLESHANGTPVPEWVDAQVNGPRLPESTAGLEGLMQRITAKRDEIEADTEDVPEPWMGNP